MKRTIFFVLLILQAAVSFSQSSYQDSITAYIKNYINNHEVVKGEDRKELHFFEANEKFKVLAKFERSSNNQWFEMPTSGRLKQIFRVYGTLSFTINDTLVKMNLYQSQGLMGSNEYKNYLFLPFTDATTGVETYESGRYIDLQTSDIKNNQIIIDFNKAYNPYCAYVSGVYNCPIPPRENHLAVAIRAGEKTYGKH
ncbi:MAG TPA: DUF1684 domain-containing protein [Flavisolibacter sp.]|nr:DUF1684 domain-containing protein [Flavisolibacter sp.]